MAGQNYRDLIAWQKAIELVVAVYKATSAFPKEETYGLVSQLRRAAVSVPSNIAEGQGRHTKRDFLNFLSIAHGSLRELETQIVISFRLGYIRDEQRADLMEQSEEVGRLITGLANSLRRELS